MCMMQMQHAKAPGMCVNGRQHCCWLSHKQSLSHEEVVRGRWAASMSDYLIEGIRSFLSSAQVFFLRWHKNSIFLKHNVMPYFIPISCVISQGTPLYQTCGPLGHRHVDELRKDLLRKFQRRVPFHKCLGTNSWMICLATVMWNAQTSSPVGMIWFGGRINPYSPVSLNSMP